jgi:hypothetical protein
LFVVGRRLIANKALLLAFTPYMLHILYHNDGPLTGDILFWFILPTAMMLNRPLVPAPEPSRQSAEAPA